MPSPSSHSPINCSIPHCLSRRRERLRSIRKLLRTLNPQFDPFLELIHNSRPRPLTRPEQKNIPFLTQFGRTDFCISVSVYWLPHGNPPFKDDSLFWLGRYYILALNSTPAAPISIYLRDRWERRLP